MSTRLPILIAVAVCGGVSAAHICGVANQAPDRVVLSIVGTSDLHGSVSPRNGRGGVALLGGYVKNLRQARAVDGGSVLLIDAGDTYQGTVESNLSEGAIVVDAYHALGYVAAAVGNHEFDFGAVDSWGWRDHTAYISGAPDTDPRGALKALAVRAKFPFLAANLLDAQTGMPVDWPNVRPSLLLDRAGVKVGILGVMTMDALRSTLVVNARGLRVAPLAETIKTEARKLRSEGADLVIVASHAGGRCTRFDQPDDLSSCEESEIFRVAGSLPSDLVDVIVAGHTHGAVAHRVNGIAIIQAYSGGRAFGRVDAVFNPHSRRIVHTKIFPPRDLCAAEDPATHACDASTDGSAFGVPTHYEGKPVAPDPALVDAMAASLQRVRNLQATFLGPVIDSVIRRAGTQESPLGNLFARALRESVPGADVGMTNSNVPGGLRADLREGPLTFGALYDVFPFDNRVVRITLRGGELARVFEEEIRRGRRGALSVAGIYIKTACTPQGLRVDLFRTDDRRLEAEETIVVAATDFLASGAVFSTAVAPPGFYIPDDSPIVIKSVGEWLQRRGGRLREEEFADPDHRGWDYGDVCPIDAIKN